MVGVASAQFMILQTKGIRKGNFVNVLVEAVLNGLVVQGEDLEPLQKPIGVEIRGEYLFWAPFSMRTRSAQPKLSVT